MLILGLITRHLFYKFMPPSLNRWKEILNLHPRQQGLTLFYLRKIDG